MAHRNPTHESRIQTLEHFRNDDRNDLDMIEKAVKHHTHQIRLLRYWRDGNGSEGAEQRLKRLETDAITEKRAKELIEQSSRETAHAVVDEMAGKGRHRFRDGMTIGSFLISLAVLGVMLAQVL